MQAREAAIDQAVTDGEITAEQADLMKGQQALHANADFQAAMQTAFKEAVQQAVDNGVITQAQADAILAQQDAKGGLGLPGMFGGPGGHGGRGGRGGHGDFGPGGQDVTPPSGETQQPTTNPQG